MIGRCVMPHELCKLTAGSSKPANVRSWDTDGSCLAS